MQPGSRGGNRAFNTGVYGLIVRAVGRFCGAVKIRGYGYFAYGFYYLREGYAVVVPFELYN